MDHGWMGGSWMDRSIDRWIDRSLMDGWIHPFTQSFVHTSTHTGRRGFYSIKTCDREDRIVIAQPLFINFDSLNFPPCRRAAGVPMIYTRPYSGALLLLKPNKQAEIMVFFEICLFDCVACFPLAPGREKRVFVSLQRAQLILIFLKLVFWVGPVPAGPDLGCWAPAWARKTL